MTLAELLENQFRADIRFRGAAYIEAERVELTRITADHIFAVVRDGVEYQTQLSRDDGNLKTYCTCDQFQKFNVCKHLWAAILAVDEAGYLAGAVKPGYIPPFIIENAPISFEDEVDDFEFSMPAAASQQRFLPNRVCVTGKHVWLS